MQMLNGGEDRFNSLKGDFFTRYSVITMVERDVDARGDLTKGGKPASFSPVEGFNSTTFKGSSNDRYEGH